jgi:hypothetical protein
MQNFREKYAYKISLYLTLFSLILILVATFRDTFLIIGLIGALLFLLSFFIRLMVVNPLKRYKDLFFYFAICLFSYILYMISKRGGLGFLFCTPVTVGVDGTQFDCSSRGLLQASLSNFFELLVLYHYYVFILGSFVSMILSTKYLFELRKKESISIE